MITVILLLYSLWCGIAERISKHLFTVAKRIQNIGKNPCKIFPEILLSSEQGTVVSCEGVTVMYFS
jgi:hypothetical protein